MNHPSISRLHSALIHENEKGCMLIDLGSKAGTKLNNKKLDN